MSLLYVMYKYMWIPSGGRVTNYARNSVSNSKKYIYQSGAANQPTINIIYQQQRHVYFVLSPIFYVFVSRRLCLFKLAIESQSLCHSDAEVYCIYMCKCIGEHTLEINEMHAVE